MRRKNNFFGPPIELSREYILERIMLGCKECSECGEMWHWNAPDRHGSCAQINICGKIMPIRRAAWLIFFGKLPKNGKRITSKCSNKMCCNPELLISATPGKIIEMQYQNGSRDIVETARGLRINIAAWTRVTDEMAADIRLDDRPKEEAAKDYGIIPAYFERIRQGNARLPSNLGPFAGLLR